MRQSRRHWPTRSSFKAEQSFSDHLISERALRDRLKKVAEESERPEQLMAKLDRAIEESRIA